MSVVDLWEDLLRTLAADWKVPVLAGSASLLLLAAMLFYGSRLGNKNRATKCFCLALFSHLLLFIGIAQIPPTSESPLAEDAVSINIKLDSDVEKPDGMDLARLESTIHARPESPKLELKPEEASPVSRASTEKDDPVPLPEERPTPEADLTTNLSDPIPAERNLAEAAPAVPETLPPEPAREKLPEVSFQPTLENIPTPARDSPTIETSTVEPATREPEVATPTVEPVPSSSSMELTTIAPAEAPPPPELPVPAPTRLVPEPERVLPTLQEPSVAARPMTTPPSVLPPATPTERPNAGTISAPTPPSQPALDRFRPEAIPPAPVLPPTSAPPVRGLLTERQADLERPEPRRSLPPLDDSGPTRQLDTNVTDPVGPETMLALRPSRELAIPLPVTTRAPVTGNFWDNRLAPNRREIVYRHGGSDETEKAVAKALVWLARHQSQDGRWDSDGFTYACPDGELCEGHAIETESDTGLTGLALLAFLGAGHTHLTDNPHQEAVRKGLSWLLRTQKPDGDLQRGGRIYCHAMATLALTEAYAMSKDERLRGPAQKAVEWLAYAQHPESGGWRYGPKQYGDTSVYGWAVLVLRSARQAKIDVPEQTWKMAERWLPLVSSGSRGGLAAYRPGYPPSHAMTAEALFCRQVFGEQPDSPLSEEAANYVMQRPPSVTDYHLYYWYYGTLAIFQLGGERWQRWNDRLTETLLSSQRQSGHAEGSWDPGKPFGVDGGRIFTTATSALCLEVYYRYLPMFAESADSPGTSRTK